MNECNHNSSTEGTIIETWLNFVESYVEKTHSMDGRPTVKSSDAKPVESLRGNQPVDRERCPCLFHLSLSMPISLSLYQSIYLFIYLIQSKSTLISSHHLISKDKNDKNASNVKSMSKVTSS